MILGKESTPYYISHLMLVTVTNQNPPKKCKSMSGLLYSCKIVYIPALMIIVLVKSLGGKSWHFEKEMAKIKLGGGKVYLYDQVPFRTVCWKKEKWIQNVTGLA